jgi:putative membrane protein (TIGR04086 family)
MIKALIIAGLGTVLALAGLSVAMYSIDPGEKILSLGIMLTYILAGFLGGLYMGHKMDRRKFLWGIGTGLCYFLLLCLASVCLPWGTPGDSSTWLTAAALCMVGGCIGGMLG